MLIIGAGLVGCSIAFALSKRGIRTVNVDPLPAAGYGSTSHSSAIIRPLYSHVTSCAVAHESRGLWLTWRDFLGLPPGSPVAEYREVGGLAFIQEGQEQQFDLNRAAMDEVGVKYDVISAVELEALLPGISMSAYGPPCRPDEDRFGSPSGGSLTGALRLSEMGFVSDPLLAAQNLHQAAVAHGARFRFGTAVTAIRGAGGDGAVCGVVLENGDHVDAAVVVNAAGPHSAKINHLAGLRGDHHLLTRPMRHEVVYLSRNARHFSQSEPVMFDLDVGCYMRPDGADLLIGSADPACDQPDVVDPDAYNTEFTEQWTIQAHRAAQRFPELGISNSARGTVGLYDVSDDWIPIYDRTEKDGYYVAIGTSGNQFKNAPLIGEIMAEIICTDRCGGNHDLVPAVLGLPGIRRTVSLDFYSRRRERQDTSGVLA